MPRSLEWRDLAARRVGLFGIGIEGRAALERLGDSPSELVLVDDADVSLEGYEVLRTDAGGLDALLGCEVVIKSPGIPRRRAEVLALEAAGIDVVGGLGLSLNEMDRTKVICVTGTKGKSTTSSILGHLARGLGLRVEVAGNIGSPPFSAGLTDALDLLIIETSSFQATDLEVAPAIVVVSSLGEDHVDWHGDHASYVADKLSITTLPGEHRTVIQGRSAELLAHRELLGGEVLISKDLAGAWAEPLGLVGEHNLANAELARVALVAYGVAGAEDDASLRAAAVGYVPLPGRLSLTAEVEGVRYIDDSLATNPLPTIAALASFADVPVALLLGGHDRGVDYGDLLEALQARTQPTLVIGLPESGPRLIAQLTATDRLSLTTAEDIAESVRLAAEWATPGSVVLLSPAAPSFSQFTNWKERSEAFRSAVTITKGS